MRLHSALAFLILVKASRAVARAADQDVAAPSAAHVGPQAARRCLRIVESARLWLTPPIRDRCRVRLAAAPVLREGQTQSER